VILSTSLSTTPVVLAAPALGRLKDSRPAVESPEEPSTTRSHVPDSARPQVTPEVPMAPTVTVTEAEKSPVRAPAVCTVAVARTARHGAVGVKTVAAHS